MNKLVNEAIRDFLQNTSRKEYELEETLASLRAYRERDLQVSEATAAYSSAPAESKIDGAAREFMRQVSAQYPVKAAMLFGSRARGTPRADSDVDIAVILRGSGGKLMDTSLQMAGIAFDVLLETNVYISPLPIWEYDWEHPESHANPRLLDNIRRDGQPL